jgi:hypothetical protein
MRSLTLLEKDKAKLRISPIRHVKIILSVYLWTQYCPVNLRGAAQIANRGAAF